MSITPHLVHFRARPAAGARDRVGSLARKLERRHPRLGLGKEFPLLVPAALDDAPALHLDDFSEITLPGAHGSIEFLQDRARLRAGDGDLVVTTMEPVNGYEEYCRDRLGLGSVAESAEDPSAASLPHRLSAAWNGARFKEPRATSRRRPRTCRR